MGEVLAHALPAGQHLGERGLDGGRAGDVGEPVVDAVEQVDDHLVHAACRAQQVVGELGDLLGPADHRGGQQVLPGGVQVRGEVGAVGEPVVHLAGADVAQRVAVGAAAVDGDDAGRGHAELAVRGADGEVGRAVAEEVGVLAQVGRGRVDLDLAGRPGAARSRDGESDGRARRNGDDVVVVDVLGAVGQPPHLGGRGDLAAVLSTAITTIPRWWRWSRGDAAGPAGRRRSARRRGRARPGRAARPPSSSRSSARRPSSPTRASAAVSMPPDGGADLGQGLADRGDPLAVGRESFERLAEPVELEGDRARVLPVGEQQVEHGARRRPGPGSAAGR